MSNYIGPNGLMMSVHLTDRDAGRTGGSRFLCPTHRRWLHIIGLRVYCPEYECQHTFALTDEEVEWLADRLALEAQDVHNAQRRAIAQRNARQQYSQGVA